MKKYAFFAAVLLLSFCAPPLYPTEKSGEITSREITSIEVSGLKRTKPHIARQPLEKFLGREGATLDLNEVQAAVRAMGILEPLLVELVEAENELILRVTVNEKWSIFPFPMVTASSGDFNLGLFFVDSNAFGLRDQMAFGAMYGSSGLSGMAMYNHSPNRRGLPGWNTFFMYSRRERQDLDRNEEVHRRYSANQLRFSLGLNYPFTEHFSGSASVSFTEISLGENTETLNAPEEGATHLRFGPGLSLRYTHWDGFLLSQRSLGLSYGYNLALAGSSYHQLELTAVYQQPLIPGFRVNVRSGAIWKSETDSRTAPLFEVSPQRAQVDILPRRFSARSFAGFSAGLEKYIFNARWGTLSVLGSWQCVFSDGPISGFKFDHGPSGGIRFYLNRLALPALGSDLAYNVNTGLYQFAFNIGMEL